MIERHYHQFIEELRVIKKKSIQKQRRKNQYSVEFKFGSDIDFNTLIDIVNVKMEIPKQLSLEPQIRFKSDIQLPQPFNYAERLGNLMVDWFSRNYKVRKIDSKDNLLIMSLDAYDTPYANFDEYFEILQKQCPQVTQNFKKFQQMLELYTYNVDEVRTFQELDDFEQGILKNFPAQGFITRVKDQRRTTLAKIYNNQLLQFIGVNQQMLTHYTLETNLIPTHLYIDPNDEQYVLINKCYEANYDLTMNQKVDLINYNGQRWALPFQVYRFVIPEKYENSFLEYIFYVMKPEKYQFLEENDILDNYRSYFNLKQSDLKQNEQDSDTNENEKLRCGFKSII